MIGISDLEYQRLLLSVGTHRSVRPLSPFEVAKLLGKAITAGATKTQCAQDLGVGLTQISVFLNLLRIAPQVGHLADWQGSKAASIAFSTMAELRRLQHDDQVVAANAALAHKLTWKEVVQLVQIVIRSGNSVEDCIAQVLKLRPVVLTRHLFVGAVTSQEVQRRLAAMPQSERDGLLSDALAKLTGPNYPTGVRLGANEFTVLSDHALSSLLGLQPNDIETSVNQTLTEALA